MINDLEKLSIWQKKQANNNHDLDDQSQFIT